MVTFGVSDNRESLLHGLKYDAIKPYTLITSFPSVLYSLHLLSQRGVYLYAYLRYKAFLILKLLTVTLRALGLSQDWKGAHMSYAIWLHKTFSTSELAKVDNNRTKVVCTPWEMGLDS